MFLWIILALVVIAVVIILLVKFSPEEDDINEKYWYNLLYILIKNYFIIFDLSHNKLSFCNNKINL